MSFETKDSGERQSFSSGMVRDTQANKTLYHLVFEGPMLDRWAELLTRGAAKYDENNWMKARGEAELRRFKASAARHFRQWMRGDIDEDHAAAVMFNLNGAEYVKGKMAEARGHTHTQAQANRDVQVPRNSLNGTTIKPGKYRSSVSEGTFYFYPDGTARFFDGIAKVPASQSFFEQLEAGHLTRIGEIER